jgi:hypothetical protein
MKRPLSFTVAARLAAGLLLAASAQAQIVPAAKINTDSALRPGRQAIANVELLLNTRLGVLGTANDPVDMLGYMRGLYLSNYGAVFTSEIGLIVTPTIMPFRPTITKELHDQVHQKKVARLPALRSAMVEMIKQAARELSQMPDSQQIVVAVRLQYMSWEDRTGLPGQLVVSASRKDALAGIVQSTDEQ